MEKHPILMALVTLMLAITSTAKPITPNYCSYVNPMIGTAGTGHTFPGACAPFGMIQAGPESGNGSWRYCSGYNLEDASLTGFTQTHLNGTGVPDLGDIRLFPFQRAITDDNFSSKYNKTSQKAEPGYYAVALDGVNVRITATEHTAFHQYTFAKRSLGYLLVDLQSGLVSDIKNLNYRVQNAQMQFNDNRTITGSNEVKGWVGRRFFYVIRFDRPYTVKEILPKQNGEKAQRVILQFELGNDRVVNTKIGLSAVSVEGATSSLAIENPGWNFEKVKSGTQTKWNTFLSRAQVSGTQDQKVNFYTAMYHLLIQPNNIADADGKYRGANDSVAVSPSKAYYSTFSLWDTYRAAHPLYSIITPERVDGMVQSMLAHQKIAGILPIWTLWGKENYCMIGNHAIPVIVDSYLKGFKKFDPEEAYKAIRLSSMTSHLKSDWEVYNKYGYYPFDLVKTESVSRTLESAYDDYCVAQMAKAMGKKEDSAYFMKRAGFYKNLLDPQTGMMRGKDSNGNWRTPFDLLSLSHSASHGGDYTEGNAWQYTWQVQHDVNGLIDLMGGKVVFGNKLDSLFTVKSQTASNVLDVTGLIGQYAHGNEPSHHVIYLYNYAGQPYKTQELVREVFDRFYLAKPDGLCGNDDCGQMSAWYIFSAMGFYPVNPVEGEYSIGAPQLPKVTLKLLADKYFTIEAKGLSAKNKYVASIKLNGKSIKNFRIRHQDIMNGGELIFTMNDKPSKD